MTERGILFSAPMVLALLAGRKTQTRRLVKDPPERHWQYMQPMFGVSPPPDPVAFGTPGLWRIVGPDYPDDERDDRPCPYGVPGDRLWVREAFTAGTYNGGEREWVRYRATDRDVPEGTKWKPGIHMFRRLSRITLEVTEVRVQRLQDITEEDARAEGFEPGATMKGTVNGEPATIHLFDPRKWFQLLWDSINGERAPWASNPWVWAVAFRRIEETSRG